ncbi:MAG: DUF1722 domain-containing protein [Gammaproteobacteria bacterium]|nr:DUF1722 domain-containing protein [Gammaproteobacteria bacterium]
MECRNKIKIGISGCLLGEEVRYDGGHRHHSYITGTLGEWFEFRSFCPEVAIGLGIPRVTIRQQQRADGGLEVVSPKQPGLEVKGELQAYGRKVASSLEDVDGFILKRGSPSCGMERVKVYHDKGLLHAKGVGVFAAEVMAAHPLLPVEEEGRLGDPGLRENFITRVFAHHRLRALLTADVTPKQLIDFHSDHKYLLLAHHQRGYRDLGRVVAAVGKRELGAVIKEYHQLFMETLSHHADPGQHSNVLLHLFGYLKQQLDEGDKEELLESIERYRQKGLPLIVPITLLKHHFRHHPHPYIARQIYLSPYPDELLLRNTI